MNACSLCVWTAACLLGPGQVPEAEIPVRAGYRYFTQADAGEEAPAAPVYPDVVFPESYPERAYDFFDHYREEFRIPVSVGAWHWEHFNNDGPNATGYGIQNLRGTYYWYVLADPELELSGPISKVGVHVDFRFREQDRFRSFFAQGVWLWESYAYADTPLGRFKGGQIWKRFGLDWDGTFWGNVPYFDGFKLDPDWGLSLEKTYDVGPGLRVDTFLQYFFHEDAVNGSIEGADPEGLPGAHERDTGVVRVLPVWDLGPDRTLAVGLSGLLGRVHYIPGLGLSDQVSVAGAVDVTYTHGPFKVFAEALRHHGILNPEHYVSGGPSRWISNFLVGAHYQWGPCLFRLSYSAGIYEQPAAWQDLWVPGVTVALTKNMDLYVEYVRWNVHGNAEADFIEFEDGVQLVINWRY